jgi:hypothetical protein
MIESPATSIPARAAPAADHRYAGYLEDLVSRIATGDRAAFRLLYAFMAMRVWHAVTETPLGPADAVGVTRSTFVEVWYLAGAAARPLPSASVLASSPGSTTSTTHSPPPPPRREQP